MVNNPIETIDVSHCESGVYWIKYTQNQDAVLKKLIIMK